MRGKSAVSPIIGILLLIVITILFAAVVYIWVSNLLGGGAKATPTVKMSAEKSDKNYTVTVYDISRKVGIDKARALLLKEGVTKKTDLLSDYEIYGNITEECELAFIDGNADACLSVGDYFIVRGDYDTFRLIYTPTGDLMGEMTLP